MILYKIMMNLNSFDDESPEYSLILIFFNFLIDNFISNILNIKNWGVVSRRFNSKAFVRSQDTREKIRKKGKN